MAAFNVQRVSDCFFRQSACATVQMADGKTGVAILSAGLFRNNNLRATGKRGLFVVL